MIRKKQAARRLALSGLSLRLAIGLAVGSFATADARPVFTSWDLGVSVGGAVARFTQVQFPFVNQHQAIDGISTAFAAYEFHRANLTFDITANLTCRGNTEVSGIYMSSAGGRIRFTTDEDLLLNANATYAWNLPAGDREAEFVISVNQRNPFLSLYNAGGGAAPVFGDPPIATVTQGQTLILPANHDYELVYSFMLRSYTGDPNVLSTGNGTAHFDMTPIPEPATIALIALAASLRWGRSRSMT